MILLILLLGLSGCTGASAANAASELLSPGVQIKLPATDAFGRALPNEGQVMVFVSRGCLSCSLDSVLLESPVPAGMTVVFVNVDRAAELGLKKDKLPKSLFYVEDRDHRVLPRPTYEEAPLAFVSSADGVVQKRMSPAGKTWAEVFRG